MTAVAAQAAISRVDHAGRQSRGYRRVYRVASSFIREHPGAAAVAQNLQTRRLNGAIRADDADRAYVGRGKRRTSESERCAGEQREGGREWGKEIGRCQVQYCAVYVAFRPSFVNQFIL